MWMNFPLYYCSLLPLFYTKIKESRVFSIVDLFNFLCTLSYYFNKLLHIWFDFFLFLSIPLFFLMSLFLPSPLPGNKGPPLLPHPLFNFSREVMDLLKYSSLCKVDYHKFATEYHHKFNKQCRVADYGFLKLSELFDAISQSVQVKKKELGISKPRFTRFH